MAITETESAKSVRLRLDVDIEQLELNVDIEQLELNYVPIPKQTSIGNGL